MDWYYYVFIAFLALIIFMFVLSYFQTKNASVKLEEKEFMENMRKSQLIDVRTKNEYKSGHINGARNFPVNTLGREFNKLRKDKPIYLYCASGKRSGRAAVYLKSKGFTEIYELTNGLRGWSGPLK